MSDASDDFFEDTDFQDVSDRNIRQIQQKAEKVGYSDGVADGKESKFQASFDYGYAIGLQLGLELEKYKSLYEHCQNAELQQEKVKYLEMNLEATTAKDHLQYDTLLLKLKTELPIATSKFCS